MSKLDKYYSKSLKEITANNTFNMMISLDSVLFENIPSLGTLFLSQCSITRAYKMGGQLPVLRQTNLKRLQSTTILDALAVSSFSCWTISFKEYPHLLGYSSGS